jgi:hypothetical protein
VPRGSILILGLLLFGCGPAEPAGLDRDVFINVMVDLRQAAKLFPDSSMFDSRKQAIMREAGVTDSALAAFLASHIGDAPYMTAVWDTIDKRLNPPNQPETIDTVKVP